MFTAIYVFLKVLKILPNMFLNMLVKNNWCSTSLVGFNFFFLMGMMPEFLPLGTYGGRFI